jgi:hypothetical protein
MEAPGKVLAQTLRLLQWEAKEQSRLAGVERWTTANEVPGEGVKRHREEVHKEFGETQDGHCADPNAETTLKTSLPPRKRVKWAEHLTEACRWEGFEPRVEVARSTPPEAQRQTPVADCRGQQNDGALNSTVLDKAVKADNAGVPRHLWDGRAVKEGTRAWSEYTSGDASARAAVEEAINRLRSLLGLRWWKRRVCRSFFVWFQATHGEAAKGGKVWRDGIEALKCVRASGWWEWTGGSGVLFWRWPQ